jgi:pimeloyl-ACP methyl ester carboxylesterase
MKLGELWVEERGDGPELLLVQGLGNSSWAARHQMTSFPGRRVIWFDNRGTGRSSKEPPPASIEQLADDAASVLDGLGVERAHVLGHSMGGYIAQTLAVRRPDLVRSLMLVGTGAGKPGHEHVPAETNAQWLANAHLPAEEYARATMHLSFAAGWKEANEEAYEGYVAERVEYPTPPECWRAQYDACVRFIEHGLPIEQIAVPVLVVHGDADRVVPISNGRAIARRIPGAQLVVLDGVGHYPYLEDPDRFTHAARNFLDRVEAV